ncbi:MAG: type III secretion system export apparatus subunit SctS [Myxococcota bacterium]|nr:type III secretion system export apparatus subunit SctS [Myxococcota bacterium]
MIAALGSSPSLETLSRLGQEALILSLLVSLPVVGLAALIGLFVAVLQAATQIQDITLSHLPRLVVVALALAVLGPWMGAQIATFASSVFGLG